MANVDNCYYNSEGYPDPTSYEAFKHIDQQIRASGRSPNYRPLVYICSPYAGQIEKNVEKPPAMKLSYTKENFQAEGIANIIILFYCLALIKTSITAVASFFAYPRFAASS